MKNYQSKYLTADGNVFTNGGNVIMIVVTSDGTNNGLVAFKDASAGSTLFTVRVATHETAVVRFGPENAYPVDADKDFYVDITTVDGVLVLYEA